MHLARLSQSESAQAVAGIWRSLSPPSRERADVAELAHGALVTGADISVAEFLACVFRTGMELQALFLGPKWESGPGISLEIDEREASVREAYEHALMFGEPLKLFLEPRKYRRRLDQLLAIWDAEACEYAVGMRRRLRLTQAGFADLLLAGQRTIQGWEARRESPTMRRRWFLRLFALYVEKYGVRAFRRRFVDRNHWKTAQIA